MFILFVNKDHFIGFIVILAAIKNKVLNIKYTEFTDAYVSGQSYSMS